MSQFNLQNFSDLELSDLADEVHVEQAQRAQQSKLAGIDQEISRLQQELLNAPVAHDSTLRPLLFSGGYAKSQRCGCRTCIRGELNILESRRKFVLEGQ